ncbi:histidine phosphatase family protein [Dietzia sp. PP-33]|jgi:broad specificity phosphatase PhoE|uniref:histidine phosphatase family protein n=1 Tax=Dietzia sp. PP-33 TaxID=2957500 RepID=UPI0029B9526E|nr:histidine phosphatase family protein [Dietzia sp. PP-33]MDX2357333.1 histidine phosphatase family protein [Dietzia sp. PP-33]
MTDLSRLLLVRHGQSVGNIAVDEARAAGAHRLDLDHRDADTPLSDAGRDQAASVGAWLRDLPADDRPTVWLTSPYRRAADTAAVALEAAGYEATLIADERLRERDLGILDGFTGHGIRHRFPEEADRRDRIGKFYYRPPGGESWTDVLLRVRYLLTDLRGRFAGQQVCVFSHQAVIMSFRVALEQMAEHDVLRVDREDPLPNCSVTGYRLGTGSLELERYADTTAVETGRAPTTREEIADEDAS